MLDLRTFYTLYYTVLAYDQKLTQPGRTNIQPAATWEQQLKRMQSGSSSWERTQSGSNWVWSRETSARQRHYHIRLLVCQSMGLRCTHIDVVKQARPLKLCS